jgi:hypothetical protein
MRRSTSALQGAFSGTIRVTKTEDGQYQANSLNHPHLTWKADTEQHAIEKAREQLTDKHMKGEL